MANIDRLPMDPDLDPRLPKVEQRTTEEIGDEIESNLVRLRTQADLENKPPKERTPLELIAASFTILTYGQMMQFSRELGVSGSFTNPEDIAATLHKWALTHGTIVLPPLQSSSPQSAPVIAVGAEGTLGNVAYTAVLPPNQLTAEAQVETPSTVTPG